ncbi:Transcription initiation factor TFIID subunit 5 [Glycine soja]|uniref:Transcription initiation factor TFIID subunit 5 n=1 Tax=Glycine soja TaxID=3848 RepID=A0A445FT20_GLYSO|nr:Transcription initiation factor TFIID subunit 5 [Glycine soja]
MSSPSPSSVHCSPIRDGDSFCRRSSATHNSLVALDELGRRTTTSYGQEYLVRKVQYCGLFCTHYHRLAVDYLKDPKFYLCHMACQVGGGIAGLYEVTFLYRLTPSAWPKSYSVNVAQMVFVGHKGMILSLAMSPGGFYMVSSDEDGIIMMWDLSSSRCLTPLIGHTSCVWSLTFSYEVSIIAFGSADCTVKLWDVNTSTKVSRAEEK